MLKPYGEVIISDKILSHNNTEYIISLRFNTLQKAKNFMDDFNFKKIEQDFIKQVLSYDKKKDIYSKFKKNQGQLYFKVSPIKNEVSFEEILQSISPILQERQIKLKEEKIFGIENGEKTWGVVFNDPSNLIDFIKICDSLPHLFKRFVTSDLPNIQYPSYIIKILKKQKHQNHSYNPMMGNQIGMPPMGFPPQMMPMGMPPMGFPPQMMSMGMPPQGMMMGMCPGPNTNPQPSLNAPNYQGKQRAPDLKSLFPSIESVESQRSAFEQLSESEKKKVLRHLVKLNFPHIIDIVPQGDIETEEVVLGMLVDKELFEVDELLNTLKDLA